MVSSGAMVAEWAEDLLAEWAGITTVAWVRDSVEVSLEAMDAV